MSKTHILSRCLVFTLIFLCFFFAISYLVRPLDSEEMNFKSFYAEEKNSLDVIYIGGSVCIVGWVPYKAWSDQGIPSYAFGESSLYSCNVLPLVKEALKYQSPELLIFDLRPFEYTGAERKIEKSRFLALASSMPVTSLNRLKILQNGYKYSVDITKADTKLSFYIDLIRYHDQWKKLNHLSFKYAIPGLYSTKNKGFLFVSLYEALELNDNSSIIEEKPCPALAEENLNELISYLKEIGQDALFVVAPYQELTEQRKQYNYLERIITDNGFRYLNANDYYSEMGIDGKLDFYNNDHTNIFGAEKYTEFLAQYISDFYNLNDRRGDEKYIKWEEWYGNWTEQSGYTKNDIIGLIKEYNAKFTQAEPKQGSE
ncbi:MAG: hypothetical protein LLF75_01210 [Eubacteriales bacterium]|nr:hypothetical protein [Eubacteriales bacterium]